MSFKNVFDYQAAARQKLSPMAFDYYAGGAHDEIAVEENASAYRRLKLYPRVLHGVTDPDLSVTLLAQHASMPVLIAPTAFQGMAHRDGEVATARATAKANTTMILSSTSNASVEAVCTASHGATWLRLYMFKDNGINVELVKRAEAASCKAIVLTVDVPTWGGVSGI